MCLGESFWKFGWKMSPNSSNLQAMSRFLTCKPWWLAFDLRITRPSIHLTFSSAHLLMSFSGRVCVCLMCVVSFAGLKKKFSRLFKGSFLITKVTDKNLVIDWFFFFTLEPLRWTLTILTTRGFPISRTWLVTKQWLAPVMFFTSQCTGEDGARTGGFWGAFFPIPWKALSMSLLLSCGRIGLKVMYRKVGISGWWAYLSRGKWQHCL